MILEGNRSTRISIAGKEYLYFGGTNYLGLAHRQELLESAQRAFALFGWSSGASRLTSGENKLLLALEDTLACFGQAEGAITLPAGFMANQAVVEALDEDLDAWVISSQAHASIKAAIKAAKKPVLIAASQEELEKSPLRQHEPYSSYNRLGVFLEPIEALDGRLANLALIKEGTGNSDIIILDEAQSFGVLGRRGAGALEHFQLGKQGKGLVRTGTFSKAVGTYGGFVLAAEEIIQKLRGRSPCFRGSTSLPPLLCAATLESLRLMEEDRANTVLKLKENISWLNALLLSSSIQGNKSGHVPIFYLPFCNLIPKLKERLTESEIYVPSVSNYFPGTSAVGLRWTIQSGHSREELERLAMILSSP